MNLGNINCISEETEGETSTDVPMPGIPIHVSVKLPPLHPASSANGVFQRQCPFLGLFSAGRAGSALSELVFPQMFPDFTVIDKSSWMSSDQPSSLKQPDGDQLWDLSSTRSPRPSLQLQTSQLELPEPGNACRELRGMISTGRTSKSLLTPRGSFDRNVCFPQRRGSAT